MTRFDSIRPYYDSEVNEVLKASLNHPMMKAIMEFTFPEVEEEVWKAQLRQVNSIREFQVSCVYQS